VSRGPGRALSVGAKWQVRATACNRHRDEYVLVGDREAPRGGLSWSKSGGRTSSHDHTAITSTSRPDHGPSGIEAGGTIRVLQRTRAFPRDSLQSLRVLGPPARGHARSDAVRAKRDQRRRAQSRRDGPVARLGGARARIIAYRGLVFHRAALWTRAGHQPERSPARPLGDSVTDRGGHSLWCRSEEHGDRPRLGAFHGCAPRPVRTRKPWHHRTAVAHSSAAHADRQGGLPAHSGNGLPQPRIERPRGPPGDRYFAARRVPRRSCACGRGRRRAAVFRGSQLRRDSGEPTHLAAHDRQPTGIGFQAVGSLRSQ